MSYTTVVLVKDRFFLTKKSNYKNLTCIGQIFRKQTVISFLFFKSSKLNVFFKSQVHQKGNNKRSLFCSFKRKIPNILYLFNFYFEPMFYFWFIYILNLSLFLIYLYFWFISILDLSIFLIYLYSWFISILNLSLFLIDLSIFLIYLYS